MASERPRRSLWAVLPRGWRLALVLALLLVIVVNVLVVGLDAHRHPWAAVAVPSLSPWLIAGPGIYLMRKFNHRRYDG